MKGVGTNESVIIELLCSKDATEIENLKAAYTEGGIINSIKKSLSILIFKKIKRIW